MKSENDEQNFMCDFTDNVTALIPSELWAVWAAYWNDLSFFKNYKNIKLTDYLRIKVFVWKQLRHLLISTHRN